MQSPECRLKYLRLMLIVCVALILTACGAPAAAPNPPTVSLTRVSISTPIHWATAVPTAASNLPLPTTATSLPAKATATSMPSQTPPPTSTATLAIPAAILSEQLSATLTAQLPPTSTPGPKGSSPPEGFIGMQVFSLIVPAGSPPLWAAYPNGSGGLRQKAFIAIYTHNPAGWQELSRFEFEQLNSIGSSGNGSKGITQVSVEPDHRWLEVQSNFGAHGSCYDLLMFDGQLLRDEASNCWSDYPAGSLQDVNRDGQPDVVLNQTNEYIYCFACGIRLPQFKVLRWDGTQLAEVRLSKLPDSAPPEFRRSINRAIELAEGGLWKDAAAMIDQAMVYGEQTHYPGEDIASWDAALIHLQVKALRDQLSYGYWLLHYLFYGDYASIVGVMRFYGPDDLFRQETPLVRNAMLEGWEPTLRDWIMRTTASALGVQPDLAAAYFIRGWGKYIADPKDSTVVADIEKAAQLDPNEPLYSQSLAYLKP